VPDCPDGTIELIITCDREKLDRRKKAVDKRAADLAVGKDVVLVTEPLDRVARGVVAQVAPHTDPPVPHRGDANVKARVKWGTKHRAGSDGTKVLGEIFTGVEGLDGDDGVPGEGSPDGRILTGVS
jgi:hypothetical protein